VPQAQLQGLPRFAKAAFAGSIRWPRWKLKDPAVPVRATLTAWNPLIPLNVHDSALPVAIFEWTFSNPTRNPVEISLAASLTNVGHGKGGRWPGHRSGRNERVSGQGSPARCILVEPKADLANPDTGTLALTTTWRDLDAQTRWYRGGAWDKCTCSGRFHRRWPCVAGPGCGPGALDRGPVHACAARGGAAGKDVTLPVFLSWHFPKMANPWGNPPAAPNGAPDPNAVLSTYVGAHFPDAWAVAEYAAKHCSRLRAETQRWQSAVFGSSLPAPVLEAITTQASIMRTPTCFLLADGNFFGWEGCGDNHGLLSRELHSRVEL